MTGGRYNFLSCVSLGSRRYRNLVTTVKLYLVIIVHIYQFLVELFFLWGYIMRRRVVVRQLPSRLSYANLGG
jgi:hypothetical protein